VVHHVVTGVPQAEGGERVQKSVTANPFVEFTVWCEALVASIMANDEEAANHKASGHAAQNFEPNRLKENRAGDQAHEQGVSTISKRKARKVERSDNGVNHSRMTLRCGMA
jgi:hypothetical protein